MAKAPSGGVDFSAGKGVMSLYSEFQAVGYYKGWIRLPIVIPSTENWVVCSVSESTRVTETAPISLS
jgi:hypothetical protein